jgi:septum formation protein
LNFINQLHNKYNIILASSSPRRQQLLSSIGFQFEVIVPDIDEKDLYSCIPPQNYCQFLSIAKAYSVYQNILKSNQTKPQIIISADTIVVLENQIINKPKDYNEAINFLKRLSNNKHQVFTGVSVLNSNNSKLHCRYANTDVYFRKLTEQEIIDYVDTGNSMDKAGGYGIQDNYGCLFVKKINGCYNNVVGLPLELLYEMLVIID